MYFSLLYRSPRYTMNISSLTTTVPTNVQPRVDATALTPQPVESNEDLEPAKDVVEFKEAGALAQVVVAVRTHFNESRRLVDITA